MTQTNVSFGQRVTELMKAADLNQTQLADKVGLDRSVLSRIMNDRRPPQGIEIVWLADALGVTLEQILDGVEVPEPTRKDVERAQDLARRVLKAEQTRDAAVAELEAFKSARVAETAAHERLLEAVRTDGRSALEAANTRIVETERDWRDRVDLVGRERDALAMRVAELETRLAGDAALVEQQRGKIIDLQTQLTQVKKGSGEAVLVLGLLGLAGGAVLKSSGRR